MISILRIRSDSMSFTVPDEPKKPRVWFDIHAESFCESYRMEGVYNDEEDNFIYLELKAAYLSSALVSKKPVTHVEIRLGKTDFPFFTINLDAQSENDQIVKITNTVPLIVIPRLGWADLQLPYGEEFDVQAKLPRFSTFKRYVDTFKHSHKIRFTFREDQTLTIEADQNPARHFTIFKVRVENCDEETAQYEGRAVTALVEQKKISHWLHSISLQTQIQLSCMLRNSKLFQFCFKIREDVLGSFVIPAEIDDEDDENDNDSDEEMEDQISSLGI